MAYFGVFCQQKIIHGHEKLQGLTIEDTHYFPKISTSFRNWNWIFEDFMYQELGFVSEFESENGRIEVKNPEMWKPSFILHI